VLSGVSQGSSFGPLLFNIFINDLSPKMNHPKFLLFADNLKMYRDIKSVEDYKALQVDTDAVQQRCGANCMERNIHNTKTVWNVTFITLKLRLSHVGSAESALITVSVMFQF
jgi:hypothetical protein